MRQRGGVFELNRGVGIRGIEALEQGELVEAKGKKEWSSVLKERGPRKGFRIRL